MSITAPMTPSLGGSPSRSRICKKLVLKGHASSSGASYTLFLKVQLPTSDREESFFLLSDPYLELQDAIVHRLDPHGTAPALSTSAATAANSLGIPLSIDHDMNDSLIDFDLHKSQKPSLSAKSDQSHLPSVIRCDDGRFMLRTSVRTSPRSKQASASQPTSVSYMVTLNLQVPPSSKPPFAPFSVRLAVPVCLNNFMRFTVDEDIGDELGLSGITVEVDPPILPLSGQRKASTRRSSLGSNHRAPSTVSLSDDEADVTLLGSRSVDDDDGSDLGEDDSAIVGPFHACDALVVRIAAQQAAIWSRPGRHIVSYRMLSEPRKLQAPLHISRLSQAEEMTAPRTLSSLALKQWCIYKTLSSPVWTVKSSSTYSSIQTHLWLIGSRSQSMRQEVSSAGPLGPPRHRVHLRANCSEQRAPSLSTFRPSSIWQTWLCCQIQISKHGRRGPPTNCAA